MKVTLNNFTPLGDQVVVLVPLIEDKTSSGIIKTDRMKEAEAKEQDQVFKIVSVGENVTTVRVGQYALCNRVLRIPVESSDPKFTVNVVRVFDIVGVADEE